MSTNTFRRIVNNPQVDKDEVALEGNLLALLFRDILLAHRPGADNLDRKMERYYTRIYGGDKRLIAQEKNNLARALTKPSISWERFETLLQLLGPDKYVVRIDLVYGDHTYTSEIEVRNRFSDRRLQNIPDNQSKKRRRKTDSEQDKPKESDHE